MDAALSAWKSGTALNAFGETNPGVHAVDSAWSSGKKLADYAVGEPEPGATPPRWNVTLTLEGQKEPLKTTYVLVGADPIWVYRDEDFTRTLNMDDNPAPAKSRARPRGR